MASLMSEAGINMLDFVCERGVHYEYYPSIHDSFLPLAAFQQELTRENGASRMHNVSLHYERIFKSKIRVR